MKTDPNRYIDLFAPTEQNTFKQVAVNPQNLTLSSEAALLSFRIEEHVRDLAQALIDWKAFADVWDKLKTAHYAHGGLGIEQYIEKIDELQQNAAKKEAIWKDIVQLVKHKCALIEAETNLRKVEQKLIDVEIVKNIISRITDIIKGTVADAQLRKKLLELINHAISEKA